MTDWKQELRDLNALKQEGLISEEEFIAERSRIMQSRNQQSSSPNQQISSPNLNKLGSYRSTDSTISA